MTNARRAFLWIVAIGVIVILVGGTVAARQYGEGVGNLFTGLLDAGSAVIQKIQEWVAERRGNDAATTAGLLLSSVR